MNCTPVLKDGLPWQRRKKKKFNLFEKLNFYAAAGIY